MLLLTSTNDKIQVITGSAGDVEVHASWVDLNGSTVTPGRTNTANITTAATTDIVAAPATSTQRNIKHLSIFNNHATVSNVITVQHTDGTNVEVLKKVTLAPSESLDLNANGDWVYYTAFGYPQTGNQIVENNTGINGSLAETINRFICPEVNTTGAASGTLRLDAVYLKAGTLVTNISYFSATTAAGTPTNGFFALYDGNRNLLAQSANFTTEAWAANTIKTKAMTTAYRVTVSGIYYIGVMITATTVPTYKGGTAKTGGQLAGTAPILHGNSTTGLTTSLPNPAAAITAGTGSIWAAIT